MAKYSNVVTYDIKTTLDASGITKLRSELNKLNQQVTTVGKMQWGLKDSEIQRTVTQVNKLQAAITECFNPRIGILDLSKFNQILTQEKTLLGSIGTDWAKLGAQGTRAINSLASSVLTLNKDAITMNSTLSKIANTFSNTVRWGITASIFQEMMSSVQGAVSYMKNLDESLTQIQMVTNSSKENMRELAQYANNAAQALGSTTVDYTNAVKVFVQEGFSESESKQYANLSTKLANVSEQSTAVTSDQITAYRNAFQLDYQQTVEAMDKVANVANNTASNVNELMTASQRAASVAQAVGSSQDSFLAAIATIESVTRQSAEEIGNGLKTIYQRFADIKVSGSTEDGVDYGQYAKALQQVGVDVLDVSGQFKGMDQILSELQEVWSSLDDTMKIAVGEKVAGKFQYNRFAALMNNPEYYQKALAATGAGSQGMMDQMNEYYVESIEGRLNILRSAGEQIISSLFDQDNFEPAIEAATNFLNIINNIIETLGGGLPVFEALSAVILRTFSSQIGEQVARISTNIQTSMQASRNAGLMDTALGQIQEKTGQQGGAIGEIRSVLQGEDFAGLSDTTQEKVLANAQQLLEAENRVADVKDQQQLLQKQINKDLANNSELADVILAEDKAQYELGAKQLQQAQDEFDIKIASGDLSEEEIEYEENRLRAAEEAVEADRIRYEQTQARVNLGEQLDNYTLEELVALDKRNAELGQTTNYAEKYLQYTQQASAAEGELVAASSQLKGTQEQINTERIVTSVTNLVSGLTSVLFLTQSAISLWQLWTNEDASFEDKVVGTISSLAMILPMAVTAWQALVSVRLADVAAGAASLAGHVATIPVLITEGLAASAASAGFTGLATAISTANAASTATPIGWILAGMAAIVAIIAGLVAGFNAWQDSLHSANREFENQKELLAELKHHYDEINESVSTLKKSIDSIGEKRAALNDLEEGTLEWKEAVVALNQEVVNLLETYPKLAEFVKNENGILGFEEGALDRFYEEQLDVARSAQNMVTIQQARTYSASSDSAIEDFANQYSNGFHTIPKEVVETFVDKINEGSIDIKEACEKLGLDVDENGDELTALTETVKSNSVATDALNATLEKTTDYKSFASTPDGEEAYQEAAKNLEEKYGHNVFNQGGFFEDSAVIAALDRREQTVNEQSFKDLVQGSMPELKGSITLIKEAADNWNWVIKTSAGEEVEINKQNLKEKMALYQAEQDIEQKKLEENKRIYENLGVEWDNDTNKPKGELSEDNQAALDAFSNNESFQKAIKEYSDTYNIPIDTVEQFSEALRDGVINVDGLAEAIKELTPDVVDLKHNINGNEFTNRVDISSNEDSLKNILDDAEMSEGAFNRMARDSYEDSDGYYQQEKERLEELIEVKKEDGVVTDDEREEIEKLNSEIDGLSESSKDTTAMIINMSDGVVDLRKKIKDISEILSDEALKGSVEWYEALADLDEGLSQVLNIDAGTLSDTFLESGDALAYAQRMAEGDMSAIDDLRKAASQDIIQNLNIQVTGEESVDELRAQLMTELNQLQADIDAGVITVTTDLDTNPFIQKLNEMLAASQISEEQATQILSSVGMEANIKHKQAMGKVSQIEYLPHFTGDALMVDLPWGGSVNLPGIKMEAITKQVDAPMDIPYLEGTHYTGSGIQTASVAASNPSYTGGYSGNSTPKSSKSSSPKKGTSKNNKPKDYQNSEWDYLTDITNDLDRTEAVMERLSKLEDRLYGASRVSQLKKISNEYKKYIALLDKEVKLAQKHAKTLREKATDENGNLTINGYANQAGFDKVEFDAKGNIQNGKAIEEALLKQLNQATTNYNNHRNDEDTSKYEAALSLAQKNYDGFMKALSEYEATLGTIEDGQNGIQDYKEKIQDAADAVVDSIQEGIDNVVEAIDNQREFMKTYRDWQQGGSGYSHFENDRQYYSEGLEGIFSPTKGSNGASVFDEQLTNLQNRYKDAKKVFDGNSNNADDEALSEAAAQNHLRKATDDLTKTLNSAIGYYDSLMDTIDKASKKMDDLIDSRLEEFDDINSYLDSKLEQSQLLFGDRPENNSQFYQQKIATSMEKMVSINTAIEAKQATVDSLEHLEASGKELSTEERQTLTDARKELAKLQKEQTDTETDLLTDIRNKLTADVTKELREAVKKMFSDGDPEWISQQWEIAARNDSQFLDDYNRAFEIEKLELKYQEALNDARKFSLSIQEEISERMEEELNWLRTKLNVSKYDVEYAEKNLEILQKRIALEEARENKTQMRLQRNVAGNYDFVYTADEDAINEAKENLLRAQQEAYNLSNQMWRDTYESAIKAAKDAESVILEVATDTTIGLEERQERVKWLLDNLGEYISNSKVELNEVSVNLYNDVVGAEQLIAEENLGNLANLFEQMRNDSIQTKISAQKDAEEMKESVKNSISGEGGVTSTLATAWENVRNSGDEAWGGLAEDIGGEEGYLKKIRNASNNTWKGIGATGKTTWHNLRDAVTGKDGILTGITTGSVNSWEKIGEAGVKSVKTIKEGTKEPLKRIKLGSEETTEKINKDVEGLVGQLGTQFQLGTTYAISSTTEVQAAVNGAYGGITQSMVEYEEANRSAVEAAGESLDTFVTDSVDTAAERLENLNETENQFKQDLEYLNNTINESAVEMANWKSQIDAAMNSSQYLITSSNSLLMSIGNDGVQLAIAAGTAEAFTEASDGLKSSLDDLADAADDVSSSIKTMASDISSAYVNLARAAKTAQSAYKNMETAANYAKSAADSADRAAQRANNSINTLNRNSNGDQIDLSWVSKLKENVQSGVSSLLDKFKFNTPMYTNIWQVGDTFTPGWYDTGGYTGKWSDGDTDTKNGKWAILHQKELVLNATDTENILSAVDIVRDIMSGINNISSYKKNIFEQQNSSNDIKQRVEISATFPGVTEAIEIKQALEQLANNAYQAANRR